MTPSTACGALIKQFEGYSLTAYPDPGTGGAPWTIGWGSIVNVLPGMIITREEAEMRFQTRIKSISAQLSHVFSGKTFSQNEWDAMICLIYNIGLGAFLGSHLFKAIQFEDHAETQRLWLLWDHSQGRVMAGLENRRKAELALYLTPDAQNIA